MTCAELVQGSHFLEEKENDINVLVEIVKFQRCNGNTITSKKTKKNIREKFTKGIIFMKDVFN